MLTESSEIAKHASAEKPNGEPSSDWLSKTHIPPIK
jgi:hypothetical protein